MNKIEFISEYAHILIYALQDKFGNKLENDNCISICLDKTMEELEELKEIGITKLKAKQKLNSPLQKLKDAVRDSEETRKQLFGLTNK